MPFAPFACYIPNGREKSLDVFSYDFSVLLAWEIERYDRISYFRGQNASLQRRDIGLLYVQCSSAPHHEFRDCAFSFETSPHDPAQVVCRRNCTTETITTCWSSFFFTDSSSSVLQRSSPPRTHSSAGYRKRS